jgi:hypothetical protein
LKRDDAKISENEMLGSVRWKNSYTPDFAEKKPPARQVVYAQEKIQP